MSLNRFSSVRLRIESVGASADTGRAPERVPSDDRVETRVLVSAKGEEVRFSCKTSPSATSATVVIYLRVENIVPEDLSVFHNDRRVSGAIRHATNPNWIRVDIPLVREKIRANEVVSLFVKESSGDSVRAVYFDHGAYAPRIQFEHGARVLLLSRGIFVAYSILVFASLLLVEIRCSLTPFYEAYEGWLRNPIGALSALFAIAILFNLPKFARFLGPLSPSLGFVGSCAPGLSFLLRQSKPILGLAFTILSAAGVSAMIGAAIGLSREADRKRYASHVGAALGESEDVAQALDLCSVAIATNPWRIEAQSLAFWYCFENPSKRAREKRIQDLLKQLPKEYGPIPRNEAQRVLDPVVFVTSLELFLASSEDFRTSWAKFKQKLEKRVSELNEAGSRHGAQADLAAQYFQLESVISDGLKDRVESKEALLAAAREAIEKLEKVDASVRSTMHAWCEGIADKAGQAALLAEDRRLARRAFDSVIQSRLVKTREVLVPSVGGLALPYMLRQYDRIAKAPAPLDSSPSQAQFERYWFEWMTWALKTWQIEPGGDLDSSWESFKDPKAWDSASVEGLEKSALTDLIVKSLERGWE